MLRRYRSKRPDIARSLLFRLPLLLFASSIGLLSIVQPVNAQVNVLTYRNDNTRSGANTDESILTPSNVNVNSFGKLFTYPVDGYVYAQPLYMSNVAIAGKGAHNVVFVATEHDSVYAFDADDAVDNPNPLWQTSFLKPMSKLVATVTTVPSADVNSTDLTPEIGITGTPVIDPSAGILYVVAKTKETSTSSVVSYVQRLHALNIHSGAEMPGSPIVIQASVPGVGAASVNGVIAFDPLMHLQRPALLLLNGVVYIAWGSHGDNDPYHGWVMGYRYETLQTGTASVGSLSTGPTAGGSAQFGGRLSQVSIFNTTPNGERGGIWQSGAGLVADSDGNIYLMTGNGSFDESLGNFGDSVLKLSTANGLTAMDYFTPEDQAYLEDNDLDLGAGGLLLLPAYPGLFSTANADVKANVQDDLTSPPDLNSITSRLGSFFLSPPYPEVAITPNPYLLLGGGKDGNVYIMNPENLGQFNVNENNVLWQITRGVGNAGVDIFSTPAYWHGAIYYWGNGDYLRCFGVTTFQAQNVSLSSGFSGLPFSALSKNGSATISGSVLALTNGSANAYGSVFASGRVNAAQFTTSFHFQLAPANGEGLTFTLQTGSPDCVGSSGSGLGYAGIANSVAIKFDTYDDDGEGSDSTGLYINGASPTIPATDLTSSGVNLQSGDVFLATLNYDGATLTVTIQDTVTNQSATQSYSVDIPDAIGGNLAYAGFTSSTSASPLTATEEILDWTYTAPATSEIDFGQTAQAVDHTGFPGASPIVSSLGAANGIVWGLQTDGAHAGTPSILHAYDAANIARDLYSSYTAANNRDAPGPAVKFTLPMVANGKVFVATQTGLTAYGLLNLNQPAFTYAYDQAQRNADGTYTVPITLSNKGNLTAANLQLTAASAGSSPTSTTSTISTLPLSVGTLLVGQSATAYLVFPPSTGAPGARVTLTISGSWNGSATNQGTFNNTVSIVLP